VEHGNDDITDEWAAEASSGPVTPAELVEEGRAVRAQAEHVRQQSVQRRRRIAEARERAGRTSADRDPAGTVPLARHRLATRLARLSGELLATDDLAGMIGHVLSAARELVAGTDGVSVVIRLDEGHFATPAHTDALAGRLDEAQYQSMQGPALDATRSAEPGVVGWPDLAADPPWPAFAGTALRLGVRSVLAVGLVPGSPPPRLGALVFYGRRPRTLTDLDTAVALAAQVSTALIAAERVALQRDRIHQLEQAIASRDVIGQAKGVLMSRYGVAPEAAFRLLSTTSQQHNVKLRDVAEHLLQHGDLDV
jgi:GAF domain-containing protein